MTITLIVLVMLTVALFLMATIEYMKLHHELVPITKVQGRLSAKFRDGLKTK